MIRAIGIAVAGLSVAGCSPTVDWAASALFGLPVSDECREFVERQEAEIREYTSLVKVFLKDDATPAEVNAVRMELEQLDGVASVTYVSKAAALERAKELFEGSPEVTANLPGNPFPASLDVRFEDDPPNDAELDGRIGALAGVDAIGRGGEKAEQALDAMRDGAMGRNCHEFMDEMNKESQ